MAKTKKKNEVRWTKKKQQQTFEIKHDGILFPTTTTYECVKRFYVCHLLLLIASYFFILLTIFDKSNNGYIPEEKLFNLCSDPAKNEKKNNNNNQMYVDHIHLMTNDNVYVYTFCIFTIDGMCRSLESKSHSIPSLSSSRSFYLLHFQSISINCYYYLHISSNNSIAFIGCLNYRTDLAIITVLYICYLVLVVLLLLACRL